MDRFGSCDLLLPNMGVAQCFVGSPWGDQWEASYSNETNSVWSVIFSSPEFLYFNNILIILQGSNIFFFLLTVYYLVDHWRNSAGIINSETKGNFLVVLKLFFIMGKLWIPSSKYQTDKFSYSVTGIPWLGEIVSHVITHKVGTEQSFGFRFAIDLLNLFTVSSYK